MKSVSKKAKPFRLINLNPKVEHRNLEPAREHSYKTLNDLVVSEYKRPLKAAGPYLRLNAGVTRVKNKGWLNAINCRNIFADGPNIDFLPQDSFGGKVELWMENVTAGDSFAIQFRVQSGSNGVWEVRSSETAMFQTPIIPFSQSIDLLIPPVESNYGMVLVSLEAKFSNGGIWIFNDVIVKKVTY